MAQEVNSKQCKTYSSSRMLVLLFRASAMARAPVSPILFLCRLAARNGAVGVEAQVSVCKQGEG